MSRLRTSITVRDESLPDEAIVLVHLGGSDSRAIDTKVTNIVKQHDRWIGVLDSRGRFALSAYALIEISEQAVLERMPHRLYGRSTVGQMRRAGFSLLPTSIEPVLRRIRPLQRYHYSIVLTSHSYSNRLLDDSGDTIEDARRHVEPAVRQILSLFEPTLENAARIEDDR